MTAPSPTNRVLLVDDDESILQATDLALRERGYDVLVARDGTEALSRVERDAPDLVVLDVVMPRRSGFAVLDRIRANGRRSPRIIVVTANNEERHRQFAKSRGADAFLGKPFEMKFLLAKVADLLPLRCSSAGGPADESQHRRAV